MSIPLILLILLGAWWVPLTILVVSCYIERVREAKSLTPLTTEEIKECKELEDQSMTHGRMHPLGYVLAGPFIIVWIFALLPLYLYGWFLKYRDPYDRHPKV